MREHGVVMLRRLVRAGVLVAVALALAAPRAGAQVPELPPEADQALDTVLTTVLPALNDAATAAGPVANAAGFALRPGCAAATSATLVLVLASSVAPLPVSPLSLIAPPLILCAYALDPGPADPVLKDVDGAVGPTLESSLEPLLDQISAALAPVQAQLGDVCGAANLFKSVPEQLPPPLVRFELLQTACGG